MAYVPRGALKGKKSKERFHIIEADHIAATDGAGTVTIAGGLVIPYGHHTGILIADLTAAFADPATLEDGWTAVYKDDTTSKIYTVHVVGDAFYLHEAAAAAAA